MCRCRCPSHRSIALYQYSVDRVGSYEMCTCADQSGKIVEALPDSAIGTLGESTDSTSTVSSTAANGESSDTGFGRRKLCPESRHDGGGS